MSYGKAFSRTVKNMAEIKTYSKGRTTGKTSE